MQQLVFVKRNTFEWHPLPRVSLLDPTDALVRPFAVARCDLDGAFVGSRVGTKLRAAALAHFADPRILKDFGPHPFQGPFAYGHECVAEIVEVGASVNNLAVGDAVVVPFQVSCGTCPSCRRKLTSHCERDRVGAFSAFGFGEAGGAWGGAMSDLLRVPHADHMLHRVPEGIDPVSLASAGDNIADGWRRVAPYLIKNPGAKVLVLGGQAKSVGLYAAGIAVALGAGRVDYVDTHPERLRIAESLGATPVERERSRRRWSDSSGLARGEYGLCVEASGATVGLDFAIRSLAPGGVCSVPAFHFRKRTPVPLWEMYARSINLECGLACPGADMSELLALVASGRFQPELVTTLVADWADAPSALLKRTAKVVVTRPRLGSAQ